MPFIRTALIGESGTARPKKGADETQIHFTGTRIRVVGSGSLLLSLISPDSVNTQVLVPFTLAATNRLSPFRLANFIEQRAHLQISTNAIDEIFRVNRITLYAKPVFTMVPA
jgi:hypothetical protein